MYNQQPTRCIVTKVGLLVLAAMILCFVIVIAMQLATTGSPLRGSQAWASPGWMRTGMLIGTPVALLVLLAGATVDSIRYSRWRRARKQNVPR